MDPSYPDDPVWSLYAVIGGQFSWNRIGSSLLTYDAEFWIAEQPDPGMPGPGSVKQIALAPEQFETLLVVDEDHNLWARHLGLGDVSSLAEFEQVASILAQNVSVTRQAVDATLIQAYVTDVNGGLWVLRQSGWKEVYWDDSAKTPAGQIPGWYDPVPLGDHLLRTFTPPGANDKAEVFAIDTGGALRSLSQDPVTTAWTDVQIQQPALPDQPAHVSSYLTTATLLDENGVPLPEVPVAITSSAPATVWVGGTAYDIGSNQPAICHTDITGKLNITSPALGLQTPSLTLTTEGLAQPLVVTPAQEVHDYLASGVQLNDLPQFDGDALLGATGADGAPLAPDLTSDGAQAAASGIAQAMSMRSAFAAAAPSSAARPAQPEGEPAGGWMMDFSDPKTPTFQPMAAAEIAAHRAGLEGALLGSFWDNLKHYAGDVWHAIEHAALVVEHFVVDAANKVVHLTLSLADQVAHLVDVAIDGIKDVVHIVHSVFVAIGAAIKRALEWLRALFGWHDILNTRTVFEYYIKQSVPSLQHLITTRAEPLVDGFFTGLEKDVRQGCTDLKQMLGTEQTLATLPSYALPATTEARALGRAGFDPVGLFSGPQRTWVFDKARANAAGSTGLEMSQDEALKQLVADLIEAVESALPDLQNALKAWEGFINNKVKQPADFKTLGVVELIDVLEDVIIAALKFTDGVIKALLDLVNAALDGLEKFLTQPVHIPLLSSLFEEISGEDLTVAGLVALIAAAPTTISYKLTFGVDDPPFTDAMVRQLTSATPTQAALTAPAAVGDNPTASPAFTYSSACVQALWALFDTCLDAVPDVESKTLNRVLSVIDIGWPTLSQMVSWPNDSGKPGKIPTSTAYDRWNLGAWACYWVPPLLDSALLAASFVPTKSGEDTSWSKLARYIDPAGKVACSAIGLVTLGVGITAGVLDDDASRGATIASNVLGPISYIGQPLRINSNVESSEGLTLAIQLLNDFFTGEGCAVAIAAS